MYLNNISDEFKGQGHRSKVKVVRLQNVIFEVTDDDLLRVIYGKKFFLDVTA